MGLPLLAAGSFIKNNYKGILLAVILVGSITAGIMSINNSINKSYDRGYNAGYNTANLEYMDKQKDLLERYSKLREEIQADARDSANKADSQRELLIRKTNQLLGKLEGIKADLVDVDCNPTDVFIGGWNELSKGDTLHIDP